MNSLALRQAIAAFLQEDLGWGDVTTDGIIPATQVASASFLARDRFLVAGMEAVAAEVFKVKNPDIAIISAAGDGHWTEKDEVILAISGPLRDLLSAERVALNLVQRLCGIATLTARFVEAVRLHPVKITDTRKTTPGLRMLEKYAVQVGGGHNHRYNLSDGVLIKDNHIAACGSITEAVARIRGRIPHTMRVEVEAETLEQVGECLACGVEIIMLDNMDPATMTQAVNMAGGKALLEASGGITLANVAAVASTGVDIISIGALTHSAPACDISMELCPGHGCTSR